MSPSRNRLSSTALPHAAELGVHLGKQAVDDVEAFVNGGAPAYVVTESMLSTMA